MESLTSTVQDYLKTIYSLQESQGEVTTNVLAERLGVTPASVTGMIQKLASLKPPLLIYQKHRGVELTDEGEKAALEVIRHHRLLELFLQKELGYSWDEVHAEADRLEHVISEEFEERMARILGDPAHDPHGEPIPSKDLLLPPSATIRLSELRAGQKATVERVEASSPELLRYLERVGLKLGALVFAEDYSPYDDNLRIRIGGQKEGIVLGSRVTSQVFVEVAR